MTDPHFDSHAGDGDTEERRSRGGPPFRLAGDTTYDLVLRVLDHQVVGPDGQFLGKVDGLELVRDGDDFWVTGIAVGVQPLAERMPGRLGHWMAAIWRRFHPLESPEATVVPITHVTAMGSSVALDGLAAEVLSRTFGIELWLREFVVSRIPGATGGGDGRDEGQTAPPDRESQRRELDPRPDGLPVTTLLGVLVEDEAGEPIGHVSEVRCVGAPVDRQQAPLRVTHLRAARHRLATGLGYASADLTGPALLERSVHWSQRADRLIPLTDLDLRSLDDRVLRLRHGARSATRPTG